MQEVKLREIFANADEFPGGIADCIVKKCEVSADRNLYIEIYSDRYILEENFSFFREAVKQQLMLRGVFIDAKFSADCFSIDVLEDAVAYLKTKNALLNGYFAGAEYTLNEDKTRLVIELKLGGYDAITDA
ncbi:MAG: hypothetical protein KBS52_00895, partial [Clostridiales bacterium]|nr:hypothetical protein [Candidatus Equinaster intestinalis]